MPLGWTSKLIFTTAQRFALAVKPPRFAAGIDLFGGDTGAGVVSALGLDCGQFWQGLSQGRPGIEPLQSVDRGLLRFQNGAEVRDWNPAPTPQRKPLVCSTATAPGPATIWP
jgi:hypothetical protein